MSDKFFKFVAAGVTLKEYGRDNWYQESCANNRLIKTFLPLLAKFNAVDVLEDVEILLARDHLHAKFKQFPQRGDCPAKEFVI